MRNISRNMTEKLARQRGTTQIDLPLVEDSLSGARTTMEDVITGKVSIADLAKDTGEKIEAEEGEVPHPPMTVTMVCTRAARPARACSRPRSAPCAARRVRISGPGRTVSQAARQEASGSAELGAGA